MTKNLQDIVYGVHPIIELLKAGKRKIYTLYTTKPEPKAFAEIAPLLKPHTQIQYVKKEVLDKMVGNTDHQSLVGVTSPFVFRSKFFDSKQSPFLVMLDSIQDARNLGAIIRSSYCTGADGLIICQRGAAPLNAAAIKASAGLAEHSQIYQAPSASAAVEELKKAGYNIYLAALGGEDVTKVEFKKPLCIVIGNEGQGISKSILNSGQKVMLPQLRPDISYNASVAAGILLFLAAHQQGKI
ncbi:RNA methyltransferase [Candidatus Dependentiae bacterium]|nr:RNA methyltransferase [Candidatus Dependentiae bacterium]